MTTTVTSDTRRLLAAPTDDLGEHRRRHGELPWSRTRELIPMLADAGLTGRGGAGFPTWRKLAAVAASGQSRAPVVVGNGAESEPASAKDAELLIRVPHLVLDGLQLAADAVGAERGYLYAADRALSAVAAAVRARAGTDHIPITVVRAPDAFVAGQESAVVAAIEGRPAVPRDNLRRVSESGVHGAPTLVQNVETLAQIVLIARHGPDWFRGAGTAEQPGTFLVTLSGPVRAPGVTEVPYGITLGDLIGAFTEPVQALLVGGYHGAWLPATASVRMTSAALSEFGASPGAGVVIALPASSCPLAYTARVVDYLAAQGARQCGPCLNGLPHLAHVLGRLARGDREPRLVPDLTLLTALVTGRGACAHPDGTARLVRSTLTMFAADVQAHLGGTCLARRAA
jgi:NADH:ubiquinone oxidoreductase subunit F (NADH-binding)